KPMASVGIAECDDIGAAIAVDIGRDDIVNLSLRRRVVLDAFKWRLTWVARISKPVAANDEIGMPVAIHVERCRSQRRAVNVTKFVLHPVVRAAALKPIHLA